MKTYFHWTTKVKTQDGKIWDLGERDFPPTHQHPGDRSCQECFIINAYPEIIGEYDAN